MKNIPAKCSTSGAININNLINNLDLRTGRRLPWLKPCGRRGKREAS